MRKRDSEKLCAAWLPLVMHIINKHFQWVFIETGTGSFRKIRRAVDNDDLKQIGWLALQSAWEGYSKQHRSKACFKTYAYRAIYNRILNYIDENCTPITMPRRWQITKNGNEELIRHMRAATNYACFSELSLAVRDGSCSTGEVEFVPIQPPEEEEYTDISTKVEDQEFHEHCIEKLKDKLTEEEWKVLMLRYEGGKSGTYKMIGKKLGMSHETVSKILEALNYKINHILYPEIREFGNENAANKSIASQA